MPSTRCLTGFLAMGLLSLLVGCKSSPTQPQNSPAARIVLQPEQTKPSKKSETEDCGLANYPVARSNQEILADVPHDDNKPPNSNMFAKIAVDKDGRVTHLKLLRPAHSDSPNWKAINEAALADVKRWRYKPTLYQGIPVAVCADVSVTIDF